MVLFSFFGFVSFHADSAQLGLAIMSLGFGFRSFFNAAVGLWCRLASELPNFVAYEQLCHVKPG